MDGVGVLPRFVGLPGGDGPAGLGQNEADRPPRRMRGARVNAPSDLDEPAPHAHSTAASDDDPRREIAQLREALWACYAVAGGDPAAYADDDLDSSELASLVVDCVRDLRGFFDAARRDLR